MGLLRWLFGPTKTLIAEDNDFCVYYSSSHGLEAWSACCIPFEGGPSAAIRLRGVLQQELLSDKMRSVKPDSFGHAIYASERADALDVENVATYNIGRWTSVGPTMRGLRIERQTKILSLPPKPIQNKVHHYWRYFWDHSNSGFLCWRPKWRKAIKVKVRGLPRSSLFDRLGVWYEVKRGIQASLGRWWGWRSIENVQFGMRVHVEVPKPMWQGRSIEVKGLIDGIAAALHWQGDSGTDPNRSLLPLLSGYLDAPPDEILELLRMRKGAVLGQHAALRPWHGAVSVGPRDDLCVALEVGLAPTSESFPALYVCVFGVS
jgi:hypothetical protein